MPPCLGARRRFPPSPWVGWPRPAARWLGSEPRFPRPLFFFVAVAELTRTSLSSLPPPTRSSANDLYKKFDQLLDATSNPVKAGDRVQGTVTG